MAGKRCSCRSRWHWSCRGRQGPLGFAWGWADRDTTPGREPPPPSGPHDGKTTKNFQAAAVESAATSNSRQFRTYRPQFFFLTPYLPPSGSDSELGGDSGTSHCPCLTHCRVFFSVPSFATESSCSSSTRAEQTQRAQGPPSFWRTAAPANRKGSEEGQTEGKRGAAFKNHQKKHIYAFRQPKTWWNVIYFTPSGKIRSEKSGFVRIHLSFLSEKLSDFLCRHFSLW